MISYKQVIIVRQDLKLPKGKLAAQACHASVDCVLKSSKEVIQEWKSKGMPKIVLKVKNLEELIEYQNKAKKEKIINSLIKDAGKTTIEPGTITCLGLGPEKEAKLDAITKGLKLL